MYSREEQLVRARARMDARLAEHIAESIREASRVPQHPPGRTGGSAGAPIAMPDYVAIAIAALLLAGLVAWLSAVPLWFVLTAMIDLRLMFQVWQTGVRHTLGVLANCAGMVLLWGTCGAVPLGAIGAIAGFSGANAWSATGWGAVTGFVIAGGVGAVLAMGRILDTDERGPTTATR